MTETTGRYPTRPRQVLQTDDLVEAQDFVRRLPMPDRVLDTIIALCRECRPESTSLAEIRENVAWGPGTRAAQALSLACRARAMLFAASRHPSKTSKNLPSLSCAIVSV